MNGFREPPKRGDLWINTKNNKLYYILSASTITANNDEIGDKTIEVVYTRRDHDAKHDHRRKLDEFMGTRFDETLGGYVYRFVISP